MCAVTTQWKVAGFCTPFHLDRWRKSLEVWKQSCTSSAVASIEKALSICLCGLRKILSTAYQRWAKYFYSYSTHNFALLYQRTHTHSYSSKHLVATLKLILMIKNIGLTTHTHSNSYSHILTLTLNLKLTTLNETAVDLSRCVLFAAIWVIFAGKLQFEPKSRKKCDIFLKLR